MSSRQSLDIAEDGNRTEQQEEKTFCGITVAQILKKTVNLEVII
jgi:hypothetical protein